MGKLPTATDRFVRTGQALGILKIVVVVVVIRRLVISFAVLLVGLVWGSQRRLVFVIVSRASLRVTEPWSLTTCSSRTVFVLVFVIARIRTQLGAIGLFGSPGYFVPCGQFLGCLWMDKDFHSVLSKIRDISSRGWSTFS